MIVAKNIHKFYENKHILKGIDIKIEEGEIVSLIGSSGAGKTTLLQILSTIEKFQAGYDSMISLNGINLDKLNKNEIQILSQLAMKKESFTVDLINQKISVKNNEINFNVDPIIKDRLIHGYDDIEITLKNKQLIVDYENNKNKFHIWKNIVYEKK